jgi:hypothetical protein
MEIKKSNFGAMPGPLTPSMMLAAKNNQSMEAISRNFKI